MKTETPIRRQYLEIKAKHKDAILLFRLGDFYEAFDDDARLLAKELDIVLTSRAMGKELPRIPLAGIPYHVLERHLATLISRGHRVAICEQTSTLPVKGADGKKLIERNVTRVVTAGTVIEPGLLESKSNNYLVSFFSDGLKAGIAFTDITTGDFAAAEIENSEAIGELQRLAPAEIILAENAENKNNQKLHSFVSEFDAEFFQFDKASKILLAHFNAKNLKSFGLENAPLAVQAAGALIAYLDKNQPGTSEQLSRINVYDRREFMMLDANSIRSLEIFESGSNASLLSVVDRTQTAPGGRLLRRWLRSPLLDTVEIYRRQEYLLWFKQNPDSRRICAEILSEIKDLERLSGRAKANYISAYELRGLGKSLEMLPEIKRILQKDVNRFGHLLTHLPDCSKIANLIDSAISEDLPVRQNEQVGIIREGYSAELDKLRSTLRNGKNFLAELERRERERTGIKSLRVGYNKVFGYYIEVTKPNIHLVPKDYVRKQTLIPAERYVTFELKEHESLVIHAQERIAELENSVFRQICAEVGKNRPNILAAASIVAYLDAIISLADVADEFDWTRPTVNETSLLRLKQSRHPVVEKIFRQSGEEFVANNASLGGNGAPQIALLTGPNASGKSTYLRQIALTVLLAQIGSFVPAEEAIIGLCDRIFTRIGLYDRIGEGESTFMTEMTETAEILHNADERSLILLDELGRGTSTYDGLAVARSVLEFIHNHPKIKSRTLFATHYHELAELENILPRLENLHVEIEETGGELNFKYKVAKGVALKSYGVYAAKLAGLPAPVIRRAETLLREYEQTNTVQKESSFSDSESRIETELQKIDIESLSPVEAMMKLYEIKNMLQDSRHKDRNVLRKVIG